MLTRNLSSLPEPKLTVRSEHPPEKSQPPQTGKSQSGALRSNKSSAKPPVPSKFVPQFDRSVRFDLAESEGSLHESIQIRVADLPEAPLRESPSKRTTPPSQDQGTNRDSPHKCVFKTVESIPDGESLESISGVSGANNELLLETLHTLKKFCVENDCSFQELFRMFDSAQKGYLNLADFESKVRSLGIEFDQRVIKFCFIYLDRNSTGKVYEPVFAQILSQF